MFKFGPADRRHAAAVAILLALSGCDDLVWRPRPAPVDPELPDLRESVTAQQTVSHHVGTVLAGQPLRHVFSYRNETGGDLQLIQDQPIRTTCGCTRARLSCERLVAGASTELALEINTDNRLGEISESATVTWLAANGTPQHCQFTLQGHVTSAFAFDPPELTFSKRELERDERKTVRCRSGLPVDWQRVHLQPDVGYLQIEPGQVDAQSGELIFHVRCEPTYQGQTRRATIRVAGPQIASQAPEDGADYHADLPVFSDDLAALRIAPKSPALQLGNDELTWHGYLILTGDQIQSGIGLKEISAQRCHVRFEIASLGSAAQRVDFTILGPFTSLTDDQRQLRLTFSNGSRHSVPVRLPSLDDKQADLKSHPH